MSSSARVARSGITSSPASSRARKPRGVQKPAQSSPPVSSTSVVRRGPRGAVSMTSDSLAEPMSEMGASVGSRVPRSSDGLPSSPQASQLGEQRGRAAKSSSAGFVASTVWGTTVNIVDATDGFKNFLREYIDLNTNLPYYPPLFRDLINHQKNVLNVNCRFIYDFNPDLYEHLVRYPSEMIAAFDIAANYIMDSMVEEDGVERKKLVVNVFNLLETRSIRALNPSDVDELVTIKGMVTRVTAVVPDMKSAFFECSNCGQTEVVTVDRGRITEPKVCAKCNKNFCYHLIHNRSSFNDRQLIKLQESPENIPDGDIPHTLDVYCFYPLVDFCKPGDRVEITGIFRGVPMRINSTRRTVKSVFRTYVDAVHVSKLRAGQVSAEESHDHEHVMPEYHVDHDETDVTTAQNEEIEARIREIAAKPDIYELLVHSIAPNIFELDDVKRGLLCQLFGGSNKDLTANGLGRFRGELNVLLCGDPGTSKSQLLQYVHKITPRGLYTSGKGSSAVGLTAYITKDPDTKEMVLESGALVLSDRGVCCIDEFDKMSDTARSILHEVMEQQTVSIAKAGIICSLNARTSILASANPKDSRYNDRLSVVENIQLPPTLMSRFDLIYLILDKPNIDNDKRLGHHLVNLYKENPKETMHESLSKKELTSYISYAKAHYNPVLTEEAGEALVREYVRIRALGSTSNRKVITATPRQLESLIRISESLAKMKLQNEVSREDVEEASRLMSVATQQAATDPRTGVVDMGSITTGISEVDRQLMTDGIVALKEFMENHKQGKLRDLLAAWIREDRMKLTEEKFKKLVRAGSNLGFVSISIDGLGTRDNPFIRAVEAASFSDSVDAEGEN